MICKLFKTRYAIYKVSKLHGFKLIVLLFLFFLFFINTFSIILIILLILKSSFIIGFLLIFPSMILGKNLKKYLN